MLSTELVHVEEETFEKVVEIINRNSLLCCTVSIQPLTSFTVPKNAEKCSHLLRIAQTHKCEKNSRALKLQLSQQIQKGEQKILWRHRTCYSCLGRAMCKISSYEDQVLRIIEIWSSVQIKFFSQNFNFHVSLVRCGPILMIYYLFSSSFVSFIFIKFFRSPDQWQLKNENIEQRDRMSQTLCIVLVQFICFVRETSFGYYLSFEFLIPTSRLILKLSEICREEKSWRWACCFVVVGVKVTCCWRTRMIQINSNSLTWMTSSHTTCEVENSDMPQQSREIATRMFLMPARLHCEPSFLIFWSFEKNSRFHNGQRELSTKDDDEHDDQQIFTFQDSDFSSLELVDDSCLLRVLYRRRPCPSFSYIYEENWNTLLYTFRE